MNDNIEIKINWRNKNQEIHTKLNKLKASSLANSVDFGYINCQKLGFYLDKKMAYFVFIAPLSGIQKGNK